MWALAQHNINPHHGATMDPATTEKRLAVLEERVNYQSEALANLISASVKQTETVSNILGILASKGIATPIKTWE